MVSSEILFQQTFSTHDCFLIEHLINHVGNSTKQAAINKTPLNMKERRYTLLFVYNQQIGDEFQILPLYFFLLIEFNYAECFCKKGFLTIDSCDKST